MSKEGANVYEREKLYKEVWDSPVTQVAKLYGVSNVAIKKICRSMNIPTPPNGYWAKLAYGKKVHKSLLPPAKNGQEVKYGINPNARGVKKDNQLSFLSIEEQEDIYTVIKSLKIDQEKDFCKEIKEFQQVVDKWNSDNTSIEGLTCNYRDYIYRHSIYDNDGYIRPPVLAGVISSNGLMRVYKILDTLIEGMKLLGYSVNEDMSFQIRGEKVEFYIYEKQSYFKHIITTEEIRKQAKYEKEIKYNIWAQEPYIPSQEYLFNGKLLFSTKKATYIQDKDETKIEDRISVMFIQLIQQSEVVKTERLKREEEQRKCDEERRRRELPIINYNSEIDRLAQLLNEVDDFNITMKIRDYTNYVQQYDLESKKVEWIEWANEKADWYDPTLNKKDGILGMRDHNSKSIPAKKDNPYH